MNEKKEFTISIENGVILFKDQQSAEYFAQEIQRMNGEFPEPTPPPAPQNPGGYIAKEKPETSHDVIELWNWYEVWIGVIIVLILAFAVLALVSTI